MKSERLPDGSAVLYDEITRKAHPLTRTASRIWEMCDGEHGVDSIVDELAVEFDAPHETIERDAIAFLRQLGNLGLLEPESGAGG